MSERLAEMIDAAQEQQRENEERALKNVRASLAPQTQPGFDGKHCVDCEELIPLKRLQDGRIRCVVCQGDKERLEARRR